MDCREYLRKYKIKVTKGRINILDIITNSKDAISADAIYEKCRQRDIKIDLSTIYRTLELFFEKQIVDKFDLGHGKYNYILKEKEHRHTIECSLCHKEVEIDCPMIQIEEIIKSKTGFTLVDHELKVKAICKECQKKS